MSFLDHDGESIFEFNKEIVFKAVLNAISNIEGMELDSADNQLGIIRVKVGISWKSWGENVDVSLIEISENNTKIKITSAPKTGILFGGALDFGKNRKNIEKIIAEVSRTLTFYTVDIESDSESDSESDQDVEIVIPETCPHCKSPNTKKIRLCEWCGSQII
jgi:hypothetical protein